MPNAYEAEYDNRGLVPEHAAIFARWARDSTAYRDQAVRGERAELGVAYGASPRQYIDFFKGADNLDAPTILFIHGGYWRANEPRNFSHIARGLNERGVTVAMAGYDLCPQVGIADIISEMRAAVLFLWRRSRRRISVFGHSAGGHLTAALIATEWQAVDPALPPDLVPVGYSISGLFDIVPLMQTSMNVDFKLDEAGARAVAPLDWPAPTKPRVFDAVVGALELSEFHRQSKSIEEKWRRAGLQTRYEDVPGVNHFTILDALAVPNSAMVERLVTLAQQAQSMV